jgi:GNAT superfamily N-acetyltransferase
MQIEYLADYPAHISKSARLHFEEWSYLRPGESLEERTARLRSSCARNAIPSVVVALGNGELLRSAMLLAHDMDSRPQLTPWLAGVFVKPQCRRKGTGSALVKRIEAEARSLGVSTLYLYTPQTESLYERLGWSVKERCEYRDTNRLREVLRHVTQISLLTGRE